MNGQYKEGEEPKFNEEAKIGTSIIFRVTEGAGALANVLKCLEKIDLFHIESKVY